MRGFDSEQVGRGSRYDSNDHIGAIDQRTTGAGSSSSTATGASATTPEARTDPPGTRLGRTQRVLGFGISAAALPFLALDTEVPITRYITLHARAASAALAWGPVAALVGTLFGLFDALAGGVLQRLFYARGDTHVDPPAFAIAVTMLTPRAGDGGCPAGLLWIVTL